MLKDAAERRVLLSDFSRSYLVEAGAGSGKTALMAGRLALLFAAGVSPERVVALSFTELAATELGNRVRYFLQELAANRVPLELELGVPDGLTADQRKAAQRALGLLDRFACTTLHSFARGLIMRHPAEANIDPGATLLNEQESHLLFGEARDQLLRRELSEESVGTSFLASAVAHGGTAALRLINTVATELASGEEHHVPEPDLPRFEALEAKLRPALNGVIHTVSNASTAPEAATETVNHLRELQALFHASAEPTETAFAFAWARDHTALLTTLFTQAGAPRKRAQPTKTEWLRGHSGSAKKQAEVEYEAFLTAWQEFCAVYEEFGELAADVVATGIVNVGERIVAEYQRVKRSRALLDFDDLIPAALTLVRTHPNVAAELQNTYEYFFIDEFQDTDPRSAELFWRISGAPSAKPWEEWPARGASRFVVGDPKQAIYRFRGADVHTYLTLREQFMLDPNAKTVWISSNFRSDKAIIDATNQVFKAPLEAEGQPGYAPLTPVKPRGSMPALWRLPIQLPEKVPAWQRTEAEAAAVAELCARFIAGDETLTDRPIAPAEIALLAPVSTHVGAYEQALVKRGIQVNSAAGKRVLKQQEVHDLLVLARVLANPNDTAALGALLRGPLVGATDQQLLETAEQHTAHTGEWALTRVSDIQHVTDPVIHTALTRVQALAKLMVHTTPEQVLRRASVLFELPVILRDRLGEHGFSRGMANVEWVFQYARDFAGQGMQAFTRAFMRRWQQNDDESEPGNDAAHSTVQIVTMHRAKGLEWPVVIPISTLAQPRGAIAPIRDSTTGSFALSIGKIRTSNFRAVESAESAALLADRTRLWYVTFTRAKEHFVLPVTNQLPPNSFHGIIDWAPYNATEVPTVKDIPKPPQPFVHDAAQREADFAREHERIVAATEQWKWESASGGDEMVETAAATPELSPASYTQLGAGMHRLGSLRGVIVHALFEELIGNMLQPAVVALTARAAELIAQLPPPEDDPDALTHIEPAEVATMVQTGWRIAGERGWHGRMMAEVPVFGVREFTAYSGIVDAIVYEGAGEPAAVVDWKSDVHPSAETREQYRRQVRVYMDLLGVSTAYIVYVSHGDIETVTR